MTDMSKIFRIRPSSSGKINASLFAYKCIYDKNPSHPIFPTHISSVRQYRDLYVDKQLKTEWLDKLNNINNILIRSVCQGHDSDHPTHIIFRPSNQNIKFLEMVISKLASYPTKCIFDIGNGGLYRVCVATKNWYREDGNNESWEKWWNDISSKINKVIN